MKIWFHICITYHFTYVSFQLHCTSDLGHIPKLQFWNLRSEDRSSLLYQIMLTMHTLHTIAAAYYMHTIAAAAAAAKSLQSCLILCDPIDGSPTGSPVPGILQARTLEWVAISFSNAWKWKVKVKSLSLVRLFVTPWTAAYQAPPSMGFSRQEYWSGVPLPSPAYYTRQPQINNQVH